MKNFHIKFKTILVVGFIINCLSIKAQYPQSRKDSLSIFLEKHFTNTILSKKDKIYVVEEDLLKAADEMPVFGVYKDTYFVSGIPLNKGVNRNTADALFQISVRQRLTKSRFMFNTFLYLTYTQKSFWSIYAESSPFRDTNYNPGIGLGKYMIQNNILKGAAFIQVEHESNGRDGLESRSWNMISLSYNHIYNVQLLFGFKAWIPIVDGKENKDLLDYKGIGYLSVNYMTKNKKWWFTAEVTPRKGLGNANTTISAALNISKTTNQYIYARFYNGKGDSLLDYNKYTVNIRFGVCIKPDFGSIF